jgi:hypothetical protein
VATPASSGRKKLIPVEVEEIDEDEAEEVAELGDELLEEAEELEAAEELEEAEAVEDLLEEAEAVEELGELEAEEVLEVEEAEEIPEAEAVEEAEDLEEAEELEEAEAVEDLLEEAEAVEELGELEAEEVLEVEEAEEIPEAEALEEAEELEAEEIPEAEEVEEFGELEAEEVLEVEEADEIPEAETLEELGEPDVEAVPDTEGGDAPAIDTEIIDSGDLLGLESEMDEILATPADDLESADLDGVLPMAFGAEDADAELAEIHEGPEVESMSDDDLARKGDIDRFIHREDSSASGDEWDIEEAISEINLDLPDIAEFDLDMNPREAVNALDEMQDEMTNPPRDIIPLTASTVPGFSALRTGDTGLSVLPSI